MSTDLYALVRFRARFRCEYCRLPEACCELPFPIDHIIARQHGGLTESDNLAMAFPSCNLKKGPNLATIEWPSRELIALYHPRRQRWEDHFRLESGTIVGTTEIGRATARLLEMNSDRRIAARVSIMKEGLF